MRFFICFRWRTCFLLVFLAWGFAGSGQTVIPLYGDSLPNSLPCSSRESSHYTPDSILIVSNVTRPTLTVYLPPAQKANGTAVLICPGGGYSILAAGHEGAEPARVLNEAGIASFVLKYRIPDSSCMPDPAVAPLQDAQQAILMIRKHAKQWGINPNRIGVMGFSAGGHLAASTGTHFRHSYVNNPDHDNLRPDFMVLVYPVISFEDSIGHMGSRQRLIGNHPSAALVHYFSNEEEVTDQTPPAFLVHAKDDGTVNYQNSVLFSRALESHHIPTDLFLYEAGGHGFGLHNKTSDRSWIKPCIEWILTDQWKSARSHE